MNTSSPFRLAVFDQSVSAGGVRRFTLAMLDSWLRLASPAELQITLFWPATDTAGHELGLPFASPPPHLSVRPIPTGLPTGDGVAWLAPQSGDFDAIYFPSTVHMLRSDTTAQLAAPAIATLHDLAHEFTAAWGGLTPAVRLEMRQWAHFAQAVIFSSDYIRDEATRLYHIPSDKTHRVYLAPPLVDLTPPAPDQVAALRAKYGLPERFALSPGTAMVHKNPAVIIEALGHLKQQGQALPLALIGPLVDELVPGHRASTTSPYHRHLQRRIVELGLVPDQDIFLLGHIPDEELPTMYAACSAVLTASHSEAGLNGPIFEGMWYQKPLICSSIPQFVERLGTDEALVYMFNPNDVDDLVRTLQRWDADPQAAQQRVQRAFEWVKARTWDDAARDYLDIFKRLAEQRAPHQPAEPALPAPPPAAPRPGFNIIGHVSGNLGLGVLARNVASTLLARNHPIAVLDLDPGLDRGGHDRRFTPYTVSSVEALPHDINLFVLPSPAMPWALRAVRAALRPGRLNVALIMWELTVIPPAWRAALECFDVIVAESEFIRHVADFNLSGVFTVSAAPPLDLPADIRPDRARWGLPADAVVYVASFEPYSDVKRKNIKAVIDAFRLALARETRAHLVIKANNVQTDPALQGQVEKLVRQMSGGHPRVHLVSENLSYRDVLGLYASADVYVSLHRAEGLGLGLMEAMALGKPVIATAWSGNLTFMDHTNACLVGQRLIPVDGTIPAYQKEMLGVEAVWADPDVAEAAAWMARLYQEPAVRAAIGQRAARAMAHLQERAARATFVDEIQAIWEHRQAVPDLAARKAQALEHYLAASRSKAAPVPLVTLVQATTVKPAETARRASVDIVVPVYGQAELLQRCVESVLRTTPDAHLILVDDCSPGPEIQALFTAWQGRPQLTLARTPDNQGFVGACRLGASLGQAPFILFLNSDTEALAPGWLAAMLPTDDRVAVVGAKLIYPAKMAGPLAGTLQHAGVARDAEGVPYHPFLGWPADTPAANTLREVNAVTGACLLVRRSVWDELGGWDARFGKGVYEDVDLCWRARAKGYQVLYQPAATLVHCESASKSPDGRHNLNAHTRENLQRLLEKWRPLESDEALFFGEAALRARRSARRHIERANAALKRRNVKAAESALRKALDTAPDLPEALIGQAQLCVARGDHGEAAALYERVVQTVPTAWEVRTHLIDAWLAAGQPERAADAWRQLHAVFPNTPDVLQRRAAVAEYLPAPAEAVEPPAAVDQAAATLELLLAADDVLAALTLYADRLDEAVLALIHANARAARQDGDIALAEGLEALAEQVADRLSSAPAPVSERAVQTLTMLLAQPDLPAALLEHEHRLDADLLALVQLNADTARSDGKPELAAGLEQLADYIRNVLPPAAPTVTPEALARAEETLQLLTYAPDIAAALEQYADRLDRALVALLQSRAEAAHQQGEFDAAAALAALAEHIRQRLAVAPEPAADAGATLELLLSADDVPAALERYAHRLNPDLLALIRANAQAAWADGERELAEGLELLAGVIAERLADTAQPALA